VGSVIGVRLGIDEIVTENNGLIAPRRRRWHLLLLGIRVKNLELDAEISARHDDVNQSQSLPKNRDLAKGSWSH
jgi:hypothetical protein